LAVGDPDKLCLDHIQPLSKGGSDKLSNVALACPTCNRAKWDLSLRDFIQWGERLRRISSFPATLAFRERLENSSEQLEIPTEILKKIEEQARDKGAFL